MISGAVRAVATDAELAEWVIDARQRVMDLVSDLSDEELLGPKLDIVNPLLWEIGHAAWFEEKWVLRVAGQQPPIREDGDALWDSIAIAHDVRWDLPLPTREETIAYLEAVRDRVVERIRRGNLTDEEIELVLLSVFHEDMHTEAFTYTRQTREIAPPRFTDADSGRDPWDHAALEAGPLPGDADIPGGTYQLGATKDMPFVFDNEKWAHPVEVKPFRIARAPVTQSEFAAFVEDGGYETRDLWTEDGWKWRDEAESSHPVYWRHEASGWRRRHFDRWLALEAHRPMIHANWYEAGAYCRWAGRRLPTEAEWELAASAEPDGQGGITARKRTYPWGDDSPSTERANLDWRAMGCVDVAAHPTGDSAFGCRQMIGNVWEWTSDTFGPFPGFVPGPYMEYSEPLFGTTKVLRGGCWATRSRHIRNGWRTYYGPERRDVWAGFRTCAIDS
jgi:iron(II)-dependent oxidoreductase